MARIFISHSSRDNAWATRVLEWLVASGWDDVFLDTHPDRGLKPGERWQQELRRAADSCEVILFLISEGWASSNWCVAEYLLAKQLGKRCVPTLIEVGAARLMPPEMTAEHQAVDITSDAGFERLRVGLSAAGIDPDTFSYDPERPPYPGFRALSTEDAAVFFGRDAQIVAGLDALRRIRSTGVRRVLVILGASGSGKSSLMRAGLWPRLHRDIRNFVPLPVVRPMGAPLCGDEGLAVALETALAGGLIGPDSNRSLPRTKGAIQKQLKSEGGKGFVAFIDAISNAPGPAGGEAARDGRAPASVVLPIDQAEELWTAEGNSETADFIRLLADAIEATPRLLIVLTIGSASYPQLQADARLSERHQELFTLGRMPEGSFRSVIERPAALANVKLEPRLIDQLLEDAAGQDALPLLAFTLERLYRDYGRDRSLTLAEYETLGGIAGAIGDAAKSAFAEARRRHLGRTQIELEELLKKVFLPHLVSTDQQGEFVRRIARVSEIPVEARPFIDLLANEGQRLLVRDRRRVSDSTSRTDEDADAVEVSHEAILRKWPLLNRWLIGEKEQLVWRQRVEQAWYDTQSASVVDSRAALLSGLPLEAARRHQTDWVPALPLDQAEFVRRSLAADDAVKQRVSRRRRQIQIGSIAAAIAFAVIGMLSLFARNRARDAQARAEQQLASASFREATIREAAGDSSQALAFLARSLRLAPDSASARTLSLSLIVNGSWPLRELPHEGAVTGVAWSPDGTSLATASAEGAARIWNVKKGQLVGVPMSYERGTGVVAWSPDGTRVVTESARAAQIWDARSGLPLGSPLSDVDELTTIDWSPDGTRLATGSIHGTARVWDGRSGQQIGGDDIHHGYAQVVQSVAWSPDGTRLATASNDKTARLWNISSGRPAYATLTHADVVEDVAWSPDGTRIATASDDGTARVWDAKTGQPLSPPLQHGRPVSRVRWSQDSTRLATVSVDRAARIWDAGTGKAIATELRHGGLITQVAWSPDGKRIATASNDRTVRVWDGRSGQPIGASLLHGREVIAIAWSPDGASIATGSSDGSARVWDVRTGTTPVGVPLLHQEDIDDMSWSPDGTRLLTAFGHTIRLWNPVSGAGGAYLQSDYRLGGATWSPDGGRIATRALWDKRARLWDSRTGQPVGQPLQHQGSVRRVVWSRDGTRIATASDDHTARLWDARTGQPLGQPLQHSDIVADVSWSRDDQRVATASFDGTARVWDSTTGRPVGPPLKHDFGVHAVVWGPGDRLITATQSFAYVWNLATRQPVVAPLKVNEQLLQIVPSPDGSKVAIVSFDSTVRLLDAGSGKRVGEILEQEAYVQGLAWSPDGTRLATSTGRIVRVWDASTGHPIGVPIQATGSSVEWSPDGTRVATYAGRVAEVWDARTGYAVSRPLEHQSEVRAVKWSSDGIHVATASVDRMVHIWSIPSLAASGARSLADLGEALTGLHVNDADAIEALARETRSARLAVFSSGEAAPGKDGAPLSNILRWFFSDHLERTLSPFSTMTPDAYVKLMRTSGQAGSTEAPLKFPGISAPR